MAGQAPRARSTPIRPRVMYEYNTEGVARWNDLHALRPTALTRSTLADRPYRTAPDTGTTSSDFSTEAPEGKFPPGLSSPPPLEKFPLNAIRLWHSSKPRRLTIPLTTTNLT